MKVICIAIFLTVHFTYAINQEPQINHEKNEISGISESLDSADISSTTENEKETTIENEDDKILFIPTEEWQEVKQFHKLPPGLHIRINMQTGLKEAKILSEEEEDQSTKLSLPFKDGDAAGGDDDDASNTKENDFPETETSDKPNIHTSKAHENLLRENIIEALKNIKNEAPNDEQDSEEGGPFRSSAKKNKKFRSYDSLKAEFESLHINIESDSEILRRLILEYSYSDDEIKLNILEDLDYLLHQIDNAVNFVSIGGLKKIVHPGLNSTNSEIRKSVMTLLGSAAQSNPKVQIAAFEEGLLSHLLRIIAREKDASISAKAVFALSCLVRGFPYGQQKLIESGGLHALREVFLRRDWHSLTLQLKVVSLIQDLLEERVFAEGERSKQLRKLDLVGSLVEGEWCSAVSSLLAGASFHKRGQKEDITAALGKDVPLRPDHDMVEKVISTMALLASSCEQSFFTTLPLLRSLKETYSELAHKERYQGQDGFELFQNLANQIQFLLFKISKKDEL